MNVSGRGKFFIKQNKNKTFITCQDPKMEYPEQHRVLVRSTRKNYKKLTFSKSYKEKILYGGGEEGLDCFDLLLNYW